MDWNAMLDQTLPVLMAVGVGLLVVGGVVYALARAVSKWAWLLVILVLLGILTPAMLGNVLTQIGAFLYDVVIAVVGGATAA